MRVLLYNSAARGTGQYIRATKIADVISSSVPDCSCRILAGNSVVPRSLPRNTDVVRLPQILKSVDGAYFLNSGKGRSVQSDSASLSEAFAVRRQIIESTINSYAPDIFIVDSRAGGLAGELVGPLSQISPSRCRCVLLQRDIVDSPCRTVRKWQDDGAYSLMRTLYSSIAFLGERSFFDAVRHYRLQTYKDKVFHVGFLGNPRFNRAGSHYRPNPSTKQVLVTVGGGFDGSEIIETICEMLVDKRRSVCDLSYTIILGANSPLTSAQVERRLESVAADVEVLAHVSDLTPRIVEADLVISMCGYNTLFELIEARKKIVAVPRGHSGHEQSLRASLVSGIYDGIWIIPQHELTSQRLAIAIARAIKAPPPRMRIPMRGAVGLMAHLVSINQSPSCG